MLRTIVKSAYVSVQGVFVRDAEEGKIVVRVGDRIHKGKPVSKDMELAKPA